MALLCIKANVGSDTAVGYQKYDIVEVLPDDAFAGNAVYLPDFLIVQVENKTVAELAYLKEPVTHVDIVDGTPKRTIDKVRNYLFNFDTKMDGETLEAITASENLMIVPVNLSDIETK